MILKFHLFTAAGLLLQAASIPGVLAEGGITSETGTGSSGSGVGSVVFKKKKSDSSSQVGSPNAWETDDKDFFKRFLKTPAAERKTTTRRAKGTGGGGKENPKPTSPTPKPNGAETPKPHPSPTPKPYTPATPTPKPYTAAGPTPKPYTAAGPTPKPNGGAPPPKAQKAGKGGNGGKKGGNGGRNPKAGKGTAPKPGSPPVHPSPTPAPYKPNPKTKAPKAAAAPKAAKGGGGYKPGEPHPTPAPYKPSNGGTEPPVRTQSPVPPTPDGTPSPVPPTPNGTPSPVPPTPNGTPSPVMGFTPTPPPIEDVTTTITVTGTGEDEVDICDCDCDDFCPECSNCYPFETLSNDFCFGEGNDGGSCEGYSVRSPSTCYLQLEEEDSCDGVCDATCYEDCTSSDSYSCKVVSSSANPDNRNCYRKGYLGKASTVTQSQIQNFCGSNNLGTNYATRFSGTEDSYVNVRCSAEIPCTTRRKLMEQPDDEITLSTPMKNDLSVTGFVRVPKTGSTTMLKFIQQARRMYAWPRHLSDVPKDANDEPNPKALRSTSCVFGHAPTTAHLGENYKPNSGNWWNSCPHIPYPRLVKTWSKSLDLWAPPKDAVYAEGTDMDSFSFSFQAFSIVRDPFDRLVSYFYYLTKFANKPFTDEKGFLSHTATKAQYDRVEAHDLVGWMELLHTEGGGRGLELPYQFKYFHSNVDEAIALIKGEDGNAPKIFTVVNECFDVSLRLLTENFSGFESDAVDTFEKSDEFKSNTNKKAYEKVSKESLKSLREKAEVWFADDYKFYDAAVEQYKLYLSATDMDKSHLEKCTYWSGDGVVGA